ELDHPEDAAGGAYYPRSPVASLVQSALHEQLARKRLSGAPTPDDQEEFGDPFTDQDLKGWIGDITLSLIGRVLKGSHRFCDAPARLSLGPRTRLILFADWGTGRGKALDVAEAARAHFDCEWPVHVLHLGDTYYSGTSAEARRNILTPWPVHPDEAG